MRTDKWQMYVDTMQAHPSLTSSSHTVDSMKFITNCIPPTEFPRMLDIGVGDGLETKILKDLGYDVTGIIRGEANKLFAAQNFSDIKFVDCDMHDLPFPCDSFDAVFMNQVFEHSFAPFILLLELYCVLRMGGRTWIAVPEFKEINNGRTNGEPYFISNHHPNVLCYNFFVQFFNTTGFRVIDKQSREDLPYFDSPYLLEKVGGIHSDIASAVAKRRELYG